MKLRWQKQGEDVIGDQSHQSRNALLLTISWLIIWLWNIFYMKIHAFLSIIKSLTDWHECYRPPKTIFPLYTKSLRIRCFSLHNCMVRLQWNDWVGISCIQLRTLVPGLSMHIFHYVMAPLTVSVTPYATLKMSLVILVDASYRVSLKELKLGEYFRSKSYTLWF